jgi:hypothetical protein
VQIDIVGFIDDRFYDVSNFDNTLDPSNGGYLQDPNLYPSGERLVFDKAITRRNINSGNFESTWTDNNVSGVQAVELSPDGSTFSTFDNTQSDSYSFGSETQEITPAFVFDNYGTRTDATPLSGFKNQSLESWTLFADILTPTPDGIGQTNARGIVPPNSGLNGETVREAGLKSGSTLLTRHELAEFVVAQDQRLASSEQTAFKGDE